MPVLVGGDGTMHYASRFIALGIPCVGVPKTIDNDLGATDQTFGFETAVNTATWAIDTLHSTAEAHDRVMILEVMGRYAGWIALCSGLAGGADVTLIPEIPYDLERVVAKVKRRSAAGASFSIVVVAEGAKPIGGQLSTIEKEARPGQLVRLGGAGENLSAALNGRVDHGSASVLGTCSAAARSAYDRAQYGGIHPQSRCGSELWSDGRSHRNHDSKRPYRGNRRRPRLVDLAGRLCNDARAGVGQLLIATHHPPAEAMSTVGPVVARWSLLASAVIQVPTPRRLSPDEAYYLQPRGTPGPWRIRPPPTWPSTRRRRSIRTWPG